MIEDLYGRIKKRQSQKTEYSDFEDEEYLYIRSLNPEFYESFKVLNRYQKSAVVDEKRALLLNAGVGSGKTTVLVHKVLYLYLIKKVPLDKMVVLTFTNKAADEIKDRIFAYGGSIDRKDLCYFGTFHSVARNLLSSVLPVESLGYTKDFSILDEVDAKEMFDSIIMSYGLNIKYRNKLEKRMDEYKRGKPIYGTMKYEDEISRFINLLEQEKKKRNVMDFDDLINNCSTLLKWGDFNPCWVIIDEFQDTDNSQLEMVDGLIGEDTHIFAVGDPNQIIYSWRGSRVDIFTVFKDRYEAREAALPINYRSTATILEAARVFLTSGTSALEGIRERGTPIVVKRHYNSFNEALYLADTINRLHENGIPYNEIAIFYRKQNQSAVFEDVFKSRGIPFEVSARKNIKNIPVLYWLTRLIKAAVNPKDTGSLAYVLCDKRYGPGILRSRAAALIKKGPDDLDKNSPELLIKIWKFKEWCSSLENYNGLESILYDYFDLDCFMSPTSIDYEEDKELVMKFLDGMKEYILKNNYFPLEGIKSFMEHTTLYGNQVADKIVNIESDSVKLMTLHASKGLEFPYVFISGANMGLIPMGGRFEDDEEKRLFFVGLTRAKDYLEISYHGNPDEYNVLPHPSPYLRMIPEDLMEGEEIKARPHRLSELKREIKNNMENRAQQRGGKRRIAVHEKYGSGYVVSETEDMVTVMFEGYGEKSFAKMFCPLKFPD